MSNVHNRASNLFFYKFTPNGQICVKQTQNRDRFRKIVRGKSLLSVRWREIIFDFSLPKAVRAGEKAEQLKREAYFFLLSPINLFHAGKFVGWYFSDVT